METFLLVFAAIFPVANPPGGHPQAETHRPWGDPTRFRVGKVRRFVTADEDVYALRCLALGGPPAPTTPTKIKRLGVSATKKR